METVTTTTTLKPFSRIDYLIETLTAAKEVRKQELLAVNRKAKLSDDDVWLDLRARLNVAKRNKLEIARADKLALNATKAVIEMFMYTYNLSDKGN